MEQVDRRLRRPGQPQRLQLLGHQRGRSTALQQAQRTGRPRQHRPDAGSGIALLHQPIAQPIGQGRAVQGTPANAEPRRKGQLIQPGQPPAIKDHRGDRLILQLEVDALGEQPRLQGAEALLNSCEHHSPTACSSRKLSRFQLQGTPEPTASLMLRKPWRSSCALRPSRMSGTRDGPP